MSELRVVCGSMHIPLDFMERKYAQVLETGQSWVAKNFGSGG